ncbi:MAG: PAS domain-containing protein, partial [Deltaproteobacteria bacterium]|nr:PAS domain-containing protein [Deltaproteobacteria bacterium]
MARKNLINELVASRRRADEELRKSDEQFRLAADFTQDWEDWIGPEGNYVYVSPSCERITGYRPDEFLRNPGLLEEITHPDDRALVAKHAEEELESREVLSLDFRIINRRNEERWIAHVCQPFYSLDEQWLGRRANNWDVTDRKRAEEALKQRNYEMAL